MTSMQVAQRITAEEYMANPPDARWSELIDGEIVVNEPGLPHAYPHTRLLTELVTWTRAAPRRGVAFVPIDVGLDEHNVYAPDIVWYPHDQVPDIDAEAPHPLPALAVEIRSPSTWRYDLGTKKRVYEREGLRELWLVDTAADMVLAYRRSTPAAATFDVSEELTQTLASPLLPGFTVVLGELFGA